MSLRQVVVATAAVVVAVASVVVVAREDVDVSNSRATASVVPPTDIGLSCPESPPDNATTTRLFTVAPDDATTDGRLTVETLAAAPVVIGSTDVPRVPLDTQLEGADGPSALVKAKGGLAPGTTAYQYSTSQGPRRSGVAISGCAEARADWWFNGVDANTGATSRLVLTNPAPGIAVVDVLIFGQQGAVAAPGSRGIALAPYSRQSVDLSRFAPGVESATVQVRATPGRVAAAIATMKVQGATPVGTDWIAAADPPATNLVVNGGLPGPGSQQLTLTNPGSREALVQGEALASSGPFRPTAIADLTVPPRSVVVTDITDIADESSTALHLTSTVDITAGVVSTVSRPRPEFASSTTGGELTKHPAVAPVLQGLRTTLCFAMAARSGAGVNVARLNSDGEEIRTESLRIKGGATTCRALASKRRTAYALISTDAPEAIQAVAHYTGRRGASTVAITPGEWEVYRLAVGPSLAN